MDKAGINPTWIANTWTKLVLILPAALIHGVLTLPGAVIHGQRWYEPYLERRYMYKDAINPARSRYMAKDV